MWIVAIAWIYVVALMSVTETSIVAGVMTFLGYCVIPLSILFYLTGGKRRRARREAAVRDKNTNTNDDSSDSDSSSDSGGSDGGGD